MSGSKIISDPVFGFIRIPSGLLLNIVKHPFMQRLTRIKQLGLTTVVYPGAQHTRFQHSLGAFHLMSEATLSLQQKGVFIFDSEAEAVQAAILMHDIHQTSVGAVPCILNALKQQGYSFVTVQGLIGNMAAGAGYP